MIQGMVPLWLKLLFFRWLAVTVMRTTYTHFNSIKKTLEKFLKEEEEKEKAHRSLFFNVQTIIQEVERNNK